MNVQWICDFLTSRHKITLNGLTCVKSANSLNYISLNMRHFNLLHPQHNSTTTNESRNEHHSSSSSCVDSSDSIDILSLSLSLSLSLTHTHTHTYTLPLPLPPPLSLSLSLHPSLRSIALSRSSTLHTVSARNWCKQDFDGQPRLVLPYVVVHKSKLYLHSYFSNSILFVLLVVYEIGAKYLIAAALWGAASRSLCSPELALYSGVSPQFR